VFPLELQPLVPNRCLQTYWVFVGNCFPHKSCIWVLEWEGGEQTLTLPNASQWVARHLSFPIRSTFKAWLKLISLFGLSDIHECASNPGRNTGTCADAVNGYTCACVAGYTGSNCETSMLQNYGHNHLNIMTDTRSLWCCFRQTCLDHEMADNYFSTLVLYLDFTEDASD